MIFPVRGFDNYASDEQKEIADFGRKLCDGKGYIKTNLYMAIMLAQDSRQFLMCGSQKDG